MEERRLEEAKKAAQEQADKVVKVSELFKGQARPSPDPVAQQLQNNQELYATLSRSLLELHNDIRQYRQKSEGMDRVVFNLQQTINKMYAELNERIKTLEEAVTQLTNLWNEAVKQTEEQDAADKEGEEDTSSNEENLREQEG